MQFSNEKLVELNSKGLIPAPQETIEGFQKRIERLINFKPLDQKDFLKWHDFDWAYSTIKELFDIFPDWVFAFYSNKKLHFWQGAMTIISNSDNPFLILQIRKQLKNRKYLFLYEKDEILSHELVHAARCGFNDPKTEEILAYWTSTSHLRKLFGPIFRSPIESTIFMMLIAVEFILQLSIQSFYSFFSIFLLQFFYLAPLTMFSYLTLRLFRTRSKVNSTLKKLNKILTCKKLARFVLFRLTDKEITLFSKSSVKDILSYINHQKLFELRWKVIYLAYFSK